MDIGCLCCLPDLEDWAPTRWRRTRPPWVRERDRKRMSAARQRAKERKAQRAG